ncbi:MAG: hypothetical protein IKF39_07620, partial [Oscillospiraceae bacterium]|nr:hypothetical protein [Oscillospiraceae bacterium]
EKPWKGRPITNPFPVNVSQPGSPPEYIRGHYCDTYLEEIRRLIADGRLPVGKVSKVIPEPDDVFVNEICIMKIQFGMDEMVFDPVEDVHTKYPPG